MAAGTAGGDYSCTVEFFADKVPWLDTAWDSIHTFIRPVGAAWIAAATAYSAAAHSHWRIPVRWPYPLNRGRRICRGVQPEWNHG